MTTSKILADSVNSATGDRLTTFELEYPLVIHAQFLTHRMFSRNSQSARALGTKYLEGVKQNPYVPSLFKKNCRGMSPSEPLRHSHNSACQVLWTMALGDILKRISDLQNFDVHKQWINRLLMPWAHIKTIVSGTDRAWENFFTLRCASDAQEEIQDLANQIRGDYRLSSPASVDPGGWHLPLAGSKQRSIGYILGDVAEEVKIATARCARISYLNHDNTERLPSDDLELYDRLLESKHLSPFEHCAMASDSAGAANYDGWISHRALVDDGS